LAIPEDRVGFYGALHNQGAVGKCLDYNPPENALTRYVQLFGQGSQISKRI